MGFNLENPIFADENVRLAIAHTIDQQAIASSVFNDIEVAAETFFPDYFAYCDVDVKSYETDTEKTKSLLESSGWVDSDGDGIREKDGAPLAITLTYAKSLASIDNFALVIKNQLEAVGFSVTLDAPDFYTFAYEPKESATLYYTSGGVYSPFSVVSNMNPNGSTDAVVYQWGAHFGQTPTDGIALLEELDSTQDEARVQEIYDIVLSSIADKNLGIPITYQHELAE